MIRSNNKFSVPSWVSCHTYFEGEPKSRTYISNEKSHTYLQLDGITSDLWKLLCDGVDDKTLDDFLKKNGLEKEIDDFIATLEELELLVSKTQEQNVENNYYPL